MNKRGENMKKLQTKESRENRLKTVSENLPQMSSIADREFTIIGDYENQEVIMYTNNITTINRCNRRGYEYEDEQTYKGEVYSRVYRFPFKDMGKLLMVTLYK